MYEEFRSTKDPTRKVELWQESVAMADTIPVPKDVLSIPYLKTQPMPIENRLYVDLVLNRALQIQQPALDAITKVVSTLRLPDHDEVVSTKIVPHLLSPSACEMRMDSEIANAGRRLLETHKDLKLENITEMKLKDAALAIGDGLVINIIFEPEVYGDVAELALKRIVSETGMVEVNTVDGWAHPTRLERCGPRGGVGVFCHVTMEGEDDGVAFTPDDAYPLVIAFHTAESHRAVIGLQAAWSEYRSANTSKQRNAAMKKALRISSEVPVPLGARSIRGPKWWSTYHEEDTTGDSDTAIESGNGTAL
jgi:hypothetical protein